MTTLYNPTDSPVPIDDDGRIVAGHEWVDVDDLEAPAVADGLRIGTLIQVDAAPAAPAAPAETAPAPADPGKAS